MTLWRTPDPIRSVSSRTNLLGLLLGAGFVVAVVASERDWLLYPVALVSGVMVPLLLGALNTMFYLATRHGEGATTRWRQAAPALIIGLAMALCEIALIGLGRDALTAALGLPF
jgi:hypothetical protein